MSDKYVDLKFIVNGQPVPVTADLGWEFREAAAKALDESGNSGPTDRKLGASRRFWNRHRHGDEDRAIRHQGRGDIVPEPESRRRRQLCGIGRSSQTQLSLAGNSTER